jgi:hypothetical protein
MLLDEFKGAFMQAIIEQMRNFRKGRLDGLSLRDLIEEGRPKCDKS